jgi:uncharacterized protein (DUF2141 family)
MRITFLAARVAVALTVAGVAAPALAQEPCAGTPGGVRVDLVVEGVRTDQGLMTATLYPAASDRFLKASGELAVWRVPSKAPATPMCVYAPAPGRYALAVYDDLNSNHHFDHTAFAPLEPYGFSNNPRLFLGLPSVGAAAFTVGPGGAAVRIRLRYPAGVG